ncbi:hypothetical protein OS493_017240 [Desmophyllum pertusum]|uniref:Uncharacterized protein n=1 Tax=Desmophyllum pertusum TaxID=174260 RepID=A0A9X0A143_9CNID|nr:hypothetical protein OS493_017240 [Desmophyllum pertusum]
MAAVGVGMGSCMLIFSFVEFILALSSCVSCCNAVCCTSSGVVGTTTVTNQQVTYIQPQYTGAQGGMVLIQPSGALTTTTHGYPGQQPVFIPQQHVPMQHVPMQQPAYWAVPPGSNPAGTVAMPYAGATGFQVQNPGQVQQNPMPPPPYSYMQTGNAPPSAASGGAPSEALTV